MCSSETHWLFSDALGKTWKMNRETLEYEEIMKNHSGPLADMCLSSKQNAIFTAGNDGVVKFWDYIRNKEYVSAQYEGRCTCMDIMPQFEANQSRVVAVGFHTGVVRILCANKEGFTILKAFKAHEEEFDADNPEKVIKQLKFMKFSPDGSIFATVTSNGEIFFFEISSMSDAQRFEPLCMVQLPDKTQVNDVIWDKASEKLLLACDNGILYEYKRPRASEVDNSVSYLVDNLVFRTWKIKMMEFQMKKN
jgi:WD40 repeat protein